MNKPAENFNAADLTPSGHRSRVRQRFLKSGLAGMQEYEILEFLLFYAIPRRDVKPLAKRLLLQFGGLAKLLHASKEELLAAGQLGESSVALLKLIPAICSYYLEQELKNVDLLSSSSQAADFMRMKLGGGKHEALLVLYLNARNVLLDYTITDGTIDRTIVYRRNIVEKCLELGATGILIGHNHPSGFCEPSKEDLELTEQLENTLSQLNIKLLDHLIVAPHCFYSLRNANQLKGDGTL